MRLEMRGNKFGAVFLRLFRRNADIFRGLGLFAAYGVWILAFHLVLLSLVTYFVGSFSLGSLGITAGVPARFEEVNDTFAAVELSFFGFASILFLLMLRWLNPLVHSTWRDFFSPHLFERDFVPAFLRGAIVASGVVLAFLFSGVYRFFGFIIQVEDAPGAMVNILLRVFSIGIWVYAEEILFRKRIFERFLAPPNERSWVGVVGAVIMTSLLFCGLRVLQFDLGVLQTFTIFLVSVALCLKALLEKDFLYGAGFWFALLVVWHCLLSLPILGTDFSGLLMVKYQSPAATSVLSPLTARLLTGGEGGVLSSVLFQVLLGVEILRLAVRYIRYLGSLQGSLQKTLSKT
ncbi:hypothetical protein WDW86_21175 [Bdellovibrionota bacterium FG-2]